MASVAAGRSVTPNAAAKASGMVLATSSAGRGSRQLIPTIAPAPARPRAISSPSPRVAPVTSVTRPASEKRSSPEASGGVIDSVPDNRLLHPYDSHQHPQGLSRVRLRQPRRGAAGRLGRVRAGRQPRVDQDAVLLPHR